MIKDKSFDYLRPGEPEHAAQLEKLIYGFYADQLQPLGITAADLFPELWTELAGNWIRQNKGTESARTIGNISYYGYIRRQALILYIGANRSAEDFLSDALDILAGITRRDLEIYASVCNILKPDEPTAETVETFSMLIDRATVDALICRKMHGGTDEDALPFYEARERKILELFPAANVTAKRPVNALSPMTKLSRKVLALPLGVNKDDPARFKMLLAQKPKAPADLVAIWDELPAGVTLSGDVTQYDIAVHNAIGSLWEAGNEFITPSQVYHTMTGGRGNNLPDGARKDFEEAYRKLTSRHITINSNDAPGASKFIYEGNLIPAERARVTINGETVDALHLFREPPLQTHAKALGQISRTPLKMLDTPVRKDAETIALQNYLQRRIVEMKRGAHSRRILYEDIYQATGADLEGRSQSAIYVKKGKIRKTTADILNYWKAESFIKDFTEIVERGKAGKITGLDIDP